MQFPTMEQVTTSGTALQGKPSMVDSQTSAAKVPPSHAICDSHRSAAAGSDSHICSNQEAQGMRGRFPWLAASWLQIRLDGISWVPPHQTCTGQSDLCRPNPTSDLHQNSRESHCLVVAANGSPPTRGHGGAFAFVRFPPWAAGLGRHKGWRSDGGGAATADVASVLQQVPIRSVEPI